MKKQSHIVPRRRQSASPASRHLPLVDILIDAQAGLQELVIASGLRVLEAMLEEDRAAVCGPGMRISRPGTRIAPAMLRAKSSWAGIKSRSVGPECGATAWRCRCPRPRRSRTRTR